MASAGINTQRGSHSDGKRQFDGEDFHARQSTAATVRKANVGPGAVPRNRCRPRPGERCPHAGLSNFLSLALFSFCSSIKFKNIPRISPRYSMRRRAVKCLFHLHFRLRSWSKAEPPLWPNCVFCCLGIRGGRKLCPPSFLSALSHLIATCRMAALPAAHSMRSSRQRKRRSQPLAVLS